MAYIKPDLNLIFLFVLISLSTLYLVNNWVSKKKSSNELLKKIIELKKFKKNYSNFKRSIKDAQKIRIDSLNKNHTLFLGEKESPITITVITSLYCSFCIEAHNKTKILRNKANISIDYRFNITQSELHSSKIELYQKLISFYVEGKTEDFETFLEKIYQEGYLEKSLINKSNIKEINEIIKNHIDWNKEEKMYHTPIILINGKILPEQYEIDDLIFFIPDLLSETNLDFFK